MFYPLQVNRKTNKEQRKNFDKKIDLLLILYIINVTSMNDITFNTWEKLNYESKVAHNMEL